MKLALALTTLLMTANAFAFTCTYKGNDDTSFDTVEISATVQGNELANVTAKMYDSQYDKAEDIKTGTAEHLAQYPYQRRGSKYEANYNRFDLSQLKDSKSGNNYDPGTMCISELHVPKQISGKFSAPLVIHCEQNGGTLHLSCQP